VYIRPAGPQDAAGVREMHARMSPDNIYLRFFSLSPLSAEQEATRVCREPGSDHVALLAWLGLILGFSVGLFLDQAANLPFDGNLMPALRACNYCIEAALPVAKRSGCWRHDRRISAAMSAAKLRGDALDAAE